jgi:hypothetical protein
MAIEISVVWCATPCSLVEDSQTFRSAWLLFLHGLLRNLLFSPETSVNFYQTRRRHISECSTEQEVLSVGFRV